MNMLRRLLPVGVFVALVALLGFGLTRDPRLVPSPLVGRPAPAFAVPELHDPLRTVGLADLHGRVALLNVWATWCTACRAEHETLLDIARGGQVRLYGLNYKDGREDAIEYLRALGNPYDWVAVDGDGRVGLDYGVYGAPETFVLAPDGTVAYKQIGPITPEVWRDTLAPLVARLQAGHAP